MNLERTAPRGDDLAELVLTAAGRRLLRDRIAAMPPMARRAMYAILVPGSSPLSLVALGLVLLAYEREDHAVEDEIHPGGALLS